MRERKVSFKQALNDAVRDGAQQRADAAASGAGGRPRVDLDKAPQLAGELEGLVPRLPVRHLSTSLALQSIPWHSASRARPQTNSLGNSLR